MPKLRADENSTRILSVPALRATANISISTHTDTAIMLETPPQRGTSNCSAVSVGTTIFAVIGTAAVIYISPSELPDLDFGSANATAGEEVRSGEEKAPETQQWLNLEQSEYVRVSRN